MLIIDLAIEGVGPFSKTLRIPFREGFNLVLGENASGKSVIYQCILSLFDFNNDYRSLICMERPEVSRAALTVKTKEGDVYRLYRDFVKNEKGIYKYNSSSKNFEPHGKDGASLKEFLAREAGNIPVEGLTNLFAINSASLQGFNLSASSPVRSEEPFSPSLQQTGSDISFKTKRLKELRAILGRVDELTKVEYQIDEIQHRITDTKKKIEAIKSTERDIQGFAEMIEPLKGCQNLPEDTPSMIVRYEEKEKKKKQEMEKLVEERLTEEEELKIVSDNPLFKSPPFIAGVVVTSLALLVTLFLDLRGILQNINFIGFLIGLGIIGYALFKDFQKGARKKEKEARINSLKKQEESLRIRYEKENAPFLTMFNKTSSQDAQELNSKFKKFKELAKERDYLIEKKRRLLDEKDAQTLEMEYNNLTKAKEDLEEKVKGYRGVSTNLYEIEAEIARLEREIQSDQGSSMITGAVTDFNQKMDVSVPSDIDLPIDKDSLLQEAQRIVDRISAGKYYRVALKEGSEPLLFKKGADHPIPISAMNSSARETLYLSLRLALFSILFSTNLFPLILDDPILSFDPQRQGSTLNLLKEMSRGRQVILLTIGNYTVEAGDNVFHL